MSRRVQVLIPEKLDVALTQAAGRDRVSKGEFVRSALEKALAARLTCEDRVARLAQMTAPTADIEQMLSEIEDRHA